MLKCAMLKYAALVFVASYAMGATCESLSSLTIPHTTIVAESVAAGAFVQAAPAGGKGKAPKAGGGDSFANLPAFCRVQVTSKPSADSDIKIEYWLPVAGWNGNFEANGNGGWTGSITANTLATGMQRGYAAAMTDTGHEGGSASFAMGHPEKVIDFGYRSTHEMATTGKTLIKAFYGRDAKHSYWNGCSAGGRQGLVEAQRYPEDFDAVVAGSPGLNWTGRSTQAVWIAQASHKEEGSAIPAAKFAAIHDAVLEACDARDGVKDGVVDEPRKCSFDPKALECKGADAPTCLTSAQVETVRKIYSDVTNPRTKQVIFQRHEPGSEMGWNTMAGANPMGLGLDLFKYVVFQDTNWDYKTMNFDSDMDRAYKADAAMDALNPDLSGFIVAWRKDDPVSRLGRSADFPRQQRCLLSERGGEVRSRQGSAELPAIYGSGNGALRWRRRHQHVRHADGDGAVGRYRQGSGPHRGIAGPQWTDGPDASAVPVSTGRELQGLRKHGRYG